MPGSQCRKSRECTKVRGTSTQTIHSTVHSQTGHWQASENGRQGVVSSPEMAWSLEKRAPS